MATRPAIFKWRQTEPVLILCAVRWYLRYSLSPRDLEELLDDRGLQAEKGQARWVGGTNVRRQIQFIQKLFELPA